MTAEHGPADAPLLLGGADHRDRARGEDRIEGKLRIGLVVGAEGHLVRIATGRHKLVIAVEWVNQAVAVEIDADDVDRCD